MIETIDGRQVLNPFAGVRTRRAGAGVVAWPAEPFGPFDQSRFAGKCVVVTSLNPSPLRRARQLACLRSWRNIGLPVVCVNTAAEISDLKFEISNIEFVTCEAVTTDYERPTQFVNSLIDVGRESGLPFFAINSDIEIVGDAGSIVRALERPECLTVGVRWNHDETRLTAERELYGLDVFGMSPEMAGTIPRMRFGVGKPVWDYWIPYHFLKSNPFHWIREPFFFHERHAIGWSKADWNKGAGWLADHYRATNVAWLRHTFREPGDNTYGEI